MEQGNTPFGIRGCCAIANRTRLLVIGNAHCEETEQASTRTRHPVAAG
jgi:hypothetical protein